MTGGGRQTVSVIIPTYNRRDVLPRAIDSVRAQTVKVDQVIVVDDASTDGTVDLLRSAYPDVSLVPLAERRGAAAARNAGIAAATSSYLAFLDSDDQFLPSKLEIQLGQMRATGARFSTTAYFTTSGRIMFAAPTIRRHLLRGNRLGGTSGLLAEASLLRSHSFDPAMRAVQDWELFLRLSAVADFVHVTEPLYIYETGRPDQMTAQKRRRLIGHVQLYRKHINGSELGSPLVRLSHRWSHAMLRSELRSQRLRSLAYRMFYKLLR